MSKRAIVIGVSDATPLAYLAGALNGARDFAQWAEALGYSTCQVTDEDEPVTMSRLRAAFKEVLSAEGNPSGIERLLIYFAGHGLIREAEEGLWLLSDWNEELRAVAVEALKRRLYAFDVRQIAIFADACRELPANVSSADLVPDAVIGRGPAPALAAPPVDKFIAAQDGAQAYMAPGDSPDEDRCIFSGVLMEGLWGTRAEALSQGKVTSLSLATFLSSEAPKVAQRYGCSLYPAVYPLLGNEVYFDPGVGPQPPPMRWPDPPGAVVAVAGGSGEVPSRATVQLDATDDVDGDFSGETAIGDGATGNRSPGGGRTPLTRAIGLGGSGAARRKRGGDGHRGLTIRTPAGPAAAGESALVRAGNALAARLQQPEEIGLAHGDCGVTADRQVLGVWTRQGARVEPLAQGWRITAVADGPLRRSEPMLIEFEDGAWAALTAMPAFTARLYRDDAGVAALLYQESGLPASPDNALGRTIAAIAAMERGGLRADELVDQAQALRQFKHQDPMLGVISAYLYEAMGDTDSIRRMAAYYVQEGQPIPYDIALLAVAEAELVGPVLRVRIPAVPAREPRTEAERQNGWTHSHMAACEGEVGGWWPWLRQGWSYLDDPLEPERSLIRPGLPKVGRHLNPARFTSLNDAGARALAQQFGLERRG